MSVELIACSMMEDEINKVLAKIKADISPIWLERQLHRAPQRLKNEIQTIINQSNKDTILLAFGLCGMATEGLYSKKAKLIIPRFHDCIHILLEQKACEIGRVNPKALYQTRGWFQGESALMREYEKCKEKYGAKKTKYIYSKMFKNYEDVVLIDTKSYRMSSAIIEAEKMANVFNLQFKIEKGTTRILNKMIEGQWDEDFIIVEPGNKIDLSSFMSSGDDKFISIPI